MKLQNLKYLSKEYSISIFTFRKFIKMGLPHYRMGKKILVNPEEFENWFGRFKIASTPRSNNLDNLIENAIAILE